MVRHYRYFDGLWLLAALLFSAVCVAQTATLEATVERRTVIDGESVLLYVRGENISEVPDFSALSKQFDVLDSRRSNSQSVENGVRKSQYLMRFELLARQLGQTEIPAFSAGGQTTQPIRIDVVARGTPGTEPRDKVFAEITLDKTSAYVQSQILLSLHILDDGSLASLDPPVPVIPDVQVERLPSGDQQIVVRDGEEYRMHTWRYALFPQRQGEIEIPSMRIPGGVRDPDYGGGLIMRSMATRRIVITTGSAKINVLPKAPDSTADWWVPVEELTIQHQWSEGINKSVVGEPLTLSLSVTSRGSTSNQIPEIVLPEVSGLKIYRDVPELASQPTETGLTSQRREKWSVIPQRAGELTLPPITIKWWDTGADREREATLPAQVLMASANPELQLRAVDLPPEALSPSTDGATGQLALQSDHSTTTRTRLWRPLAVFALVGWAATVLAWLYASRRKKRAAPTQVIRSDKELLRELRFASDENNLPRFRIALLEWADCYWPENSPQGPLEIAQRLGSARLTDQFQALEAALYGNSSKPAELGPVYNTLCESLSGHRKMVVDEQALPSL